jgi:hypothetical protein
VFCGLFLLTYFGKNEEKRAKDMEKYRNCKNDQVKADGKKCWG